MEVIKNLWPEKAPKEVNPPLEILKQQAIYLGEKTQNILIGKIESMPDAVGQLNDLLLKGLNSRFLQHHFYVIAPKLNNYIYDLFYVSQDLDNLSYLKVFFEDQQIEAQNEEKFMEILSQIFSSPKTWQVIDTLLAQSQ